MKRECVCGSKTFETVGSRSSAGLTEVEACQKCGRPAASYAAPETFNFRVVRGTAKYLHFQDVADFIRALGETEETNVRNRLNEAAANIEKQGLTL